MSWFNSWPWSRPRPKRTMYNDAELLVKWLCKFYGKPYPKISISKERLAYLNTKYGGNGDSLFVVPGEEGGPTGEIVLQRREIVMDKFALFAIVEAGHSIKDFDNHIDRFPSDDEL